PRQRRGTAGGGGGGGGRGGGGGGGGGGGRDRAARRAGPAPCRRRRRCAVASLRADDGCVRVGATQVCRYHRRSRGESPGPSPRAGGRRGNDCGGRKRCGGPACCAPTGTRA